MNGPPFDLDYLDALSNLGALDPAAVHRGAIATGRPGILGLEVTRGRVAFLTFENPDDVRMRFIIAAYVLNIDLDEIATDIVVLDSRTKPEEVLEKLRRYGDLEWCSLPIAGRPSFHDLAKSDLIEADPCGLDVGRTAQGAEGRFETVSPAGPSPEGHPREMR